MFMWGKHLQYSYVFYLMTSSNFCAFLLDLYVIDQHKGALKCEVKSEMIYGF